MKMAGGGNDWAAQQMAEFLAVITSYVDEETAEHNAVERIAESVEAEIAAIVRGGDVVTSIGFPAGHAHENELAAAASGTERRFVAPGLGECQLATAPLDDGTDARLLVGRLGNESFTAQELNLIRGIARVLTLGLKTLRHVNVERELREKSEAQAAHIQERQRLFERLNKIQLSISHRNSIQEVFDAITSGASELMGEPDAMVALRLIDESDPAYMEMVSSWGVPDDFFEMTKRTPVGKGAGGSAVSQDRLVIIEDYASSDDAIPEYGGIVQAAIGAPVYEGERIVGSLSYASTRPGRRYTATEREILLAFAQHTSLALSDARSVEELRAGFHESLSGIGEKTAIEKRGLEEELRQAQKMEAVGHLAGGIAHDFNNLLMIIRTSADFLQESVAGNPSDLEDTQAILDASDRATRLVEQLLTFSRKEVVRAEVVDVNQLVPSMIDLLRRTIGSDVTLESDLDAGSCPILIDPSHLEQIVMNLAINARDAMPSGGRLSIVTKRTRIVEQNDGGLPDGDYIRLEFADNGLGMTPKVLDHVFDPFYTTKERGRGTGLGLATVYGIVSNAGGRIDVTSEVGGGSVFSILLPLSDDAADQPPSDADEPTREQSSGRPGAGETILVVDDEDAVRETIRRILVRDGYQVISARSAIEALELLDTDPAGLTLVLSDIVMPGMSGIQLVEEAQKRGRQSPIVLMSGYADTRTADSSSLDPSAGFLQKPFTARALLGVVRDVLGGTSSAANPPPSDISHPAPVISRWEAIEVNRPWAQVPASFEPSR